MWTWYSDPFGADVPNENPASGGTFKYNLRFPGQLYDSHAGLNQNYFRDYDPAIGRYVESDPAGLRGGLNTYAYVRNETVELVDPKGLESAGYGYVVTGMELLHDIEDVPHPCLIATVAARGSAFDEAEASGLPGPTNGPQDAFRHCVGSCKLARLAGQSCAKIIGDNHEAANLASGNPIEDSEMDWPNNAAGRDAAKCEPGKPCKQKCRERLQNCQLFGRGGKHLCYPPR
jgi:RHS repeat-associated protein